MKKHIELLNKINTIGLDPRLPKSLGGNEIELRQFVFQLKNAIIEMHDEIKTLNNKIDDLEFQFAEQQGLVEPE